MLLGETFCLYNAFLPLLPGKKMCANESLGKPKKLGKILRRGKCQTFDVYLLRPLGLLTQVQTLLYLEIMLFLIYFDKCIFFFFFLQLNAMLLGRVIKEMTIMQHAKDKHSEQIRWVSQWRQWKINHGKQFAFFFASLYEQCLLTRKIKATYLLGFILFSMML